MSTEIATRDNAATLEKVVVGGDLSKLTSPERLNYYRTVCESVGLNPLTRPFEYLTLNGKLTLYARKDATDQIRSLKNVSVRIVARDRVEDVWIVTAEATTPDGRTDASIGAVAIAGLKGDALANALMKAETKAKRRVTLSIAGLGMLDETETETIPGAATVVVDEATGELQAADDKRASLKAAIGTFRKQLTPEQFDSYADGRTLKTMSDAELQAFVDGLEALVNDEAVTV